MVEIIEDRAQTEEMFNGGRVTVYGLPPVSERTEANPVSASDSTEATLSTNISVPFKEAIALSSAIGLSTGVVLASSYMAFGQESQPLDRFVILFGSAVGGAIMGVKAELEERRHSQDPKYEPKYNAKDFPGVFKDSPREEGVPGIQDRFFEKMDQWADRSKVVSGLLSGYSRANVVKLEQKINSSLVYLSKIEVPELKVPRLEWRNPWRNPFSNNLPT